MNKLLTIVIPTYNMQEYLHRCLDSLVLKDEQLMNQLEVLVINDGSKDNSSAIAHEYEAKYPNTFRVIDKENGNYGSCVNRGLKEATGKYIKVLDADDWFDTDEFAGLLTQMKNYEVDMFVTDYQHVDFNGKCLSKQKYPLPYNSVLQFQNINSDALYLAMHAIAYSTTMLKEMQYKQTEGISYTDTEWASYPLHKVRTMIYLHCDVYRYLLGRDGQTVSASVSNKSAEHYVKLLKEMISYASAITVENYGKERLESQIAAMSGIVYRKFLVQQSIKDFSATLMNDLDAFIKNNRPDVYAQLDLSVFKKWLPIHYIRIWRRCKIRIRL